MRAILINPFLKTITEVDCSDDLNSMYRLLSAPPSEEVHTFNIACLFKNRDTVYVDEEGTFKTKLYGFSFKSKSIFVGNGLILGANSRGESVDARSLLIEIQNEVTFHGSL